MVKKKYYLPKVAKKTLFSKNAIFGRPEGEVGGKGPLLLLLRTAMISYAANECWKNVG
jgi:hypothetical protein